MLHYHISKNCLRLQQHVMTALIVEPMEPIKAYVFQRTLVIWENVYRIMSHIMWNQASMLMYAYFTNNENVPQLQLLYCLCPKWWKISQQETEELAGS